MCEAVITTTEHEKSKKLATTLTDLLQNTLILRNIFAYLSPSGITSLTATNRSLRAIITFNPAVYRHLNLEIIKSLQFDVGIIDHGGNNWLRRQLDESLTEDE